MPSTVLRPARRSSTAFLAVLLAAAAALAGCAAGSSAGGGTDPASSVPASAPLYAEAVLAGDGQEQRDAQAALAKIVGTSDPQAAIARLFDRGGVQFARDVEPWIGERVGAAALTVGRGGDTIVVAASRDDDAAQAALGRIAPGADTRSYRGVSYRVDSRHHGLAAGVVGDTVVFGGENGLKAAIDASKGSSLAESDALKTARSTVRQERSGFLYADVASLLRQALAGAGGGAAQLAPLVGPISEALPKTVAAALDAEPGLLRIDSAAIGNGGGVRPAGSGADALAALPSDAWLGLGVGELGKTVDNVIDRLSSGGGLAGVGVQALLAQAQGQIGLDIRRDLLAWMGDAGLSVSGDADAPRVALVVASKDPAASQRTVRALETLARRDGEVSPVTGSGIDAGFAVKRGGRTGPVVASAGNRFVIASGRAALDAALSPSGRLGDAPAFRDAAAKLGSGVRPSFFVDAQRLGDLAAAKHGGRDKGPALDAFGALVGGGRQDGDVARGEAILTLR
jgi:uncharacterized protein DUF3352